MVIREGDNQIEIAATDRVSDAEPTPGDTELTIRVRSGGFSGEGWAWVSAEALAGFVAQVRRLEVCRQGVADIESMSPCQLRLRIWSVDRLGHLAVGGSLSRRVHSGGAASFTHLFEFGFEFDPSLLPGILAEFESFAAEQS
jgi:hypothetical protein